MVVFERLRSGGELSPYIQRDLGLLERRQLIGSDNLDQFSLLLDGLEALTHVDDACHGEYHAQMHAERQQAIPQCQHSRQGRTRCMVILGDCGTRALVSGHSNAFECHTCTNVRGARSSRFSARSLPALLKRSRSTRLKQMSAILVETFFMR